MAERCINLRDWESRHLLAHGTLTLVRPVKLVAPYVMDERDGGKPWPYATTWSHGDVGEPWMHSPFGAPGDTLVGREAWKLVADDSLGQEWAYAVDCKVIKPRPLDCIVGTRRGHLQPNRTRTEHARHRLTVESVDVKRCTDINHPSDAWFDAIGSYAPDPYAAASDSLVSGDALVKEVMATWPERRFPWATSYAWVVTVRRQA